MLWVNYLKNGYNPAAWPDEQHPFELVCRCFPVTFGTTDLFFRCWWLFCPDGLGVLYASVELHSKITTGNPDIPASRTENFVQFPTLYDSKENKVGTGTLREKSFHSHQFYNHFANSFGGTKIGSVHSWVLVKWSRRKSYTCSLINSLNNTLDKVRHDLYMVSTLVHSQSSCY